jgi:hypothetical protein
MASGIIWRASGSGVTCRRGFAASSIGFVIYSKPYTNIYARFTK